MNAAFNSSAPFILHHYDGSPFSEKLRLILGFKKMAWQSVKVPVILPKPDVVALTGGYRKTPIAQVGADIYCDTALIARLIEARAPQPTLFPTTAPLAALLAQWADSTMFWTVIPYTMQPAGLAEMFKGLPPEVLKAFAADRAPFTKGIKRQTVADATVNLSQQLDSFEAQLADGRPWLLSDQAGDRAGDQASIADFSVAHCLWYVRRGGPAVSAITAQRVKVNAWLDRVLALGHGKPEPISSAQAVEMAAQAKGHAPTSVQAGMGFELGQTVTVTPTDYGMDSVAGSLVGLSADEVVLARSDERAGRVHVHFARHGFQIKGESA
jgi:glutathione S-transferase